MKKHLDRLFCISAGALWVWCCISIMVVMSGCATTDEYEQQDEYNQLLDRWVSCRQMYEARRVAWVTLDPPRYGTTPRRSQLVSDIVSNNCPTTITRM